MKCNIKTSRELSDTEKLILKDFLVFCTDKLDIDKVPEEINIFEKQHDGMTTGGYIPQTTQVHVLGGRRMFLDILRSIAHELTHHKQNERGNLHELLEEYPEDLYSPYENEAYEMAGNIIKEWSRKFKKEDKYKVNLYEMYY